MSALRSVEILLSSAERADVIFCNEALGFKETCLSSYIDLLKSMKQTKGIIEHLKWRSQALNYQDYISMCKGKYPSELSECFRLKPHVF